jgi:hypothetical protein
MKLEQQLAKLAELGLVLNDGVTIDDLLYSYTRAEYEEEPFDVIFFMLGSEVERDPWGRSICSQVWNFDTECISQTGDYVEIVKRLCGIVNIPNLITNLEDFVDINSGVAWLKYTIDGINRNWAVEVNSDWADTLTVSYVMDDIERDGFRFYAQDNGQSMILFYLNANIADAINQLTDNTLEPANPG